MILSVNHVHKSYGNEKVLKGISFEIDKPQIVALVGPNGSGKSTLLNIITNILKADQGEIMILGKNNKNPEIFREISFMQDNSVLYDYLTGYDHLQFVGDIQRLTKEQIIETAKKVGMDRYLNKKVKHYSLGMKQHLLLTLAIVNRPKLLILDEPLNGLDPTSSIHVRNLLLDLEKRGTTILLSSHNLGEIDRVTSQILFLKNGVLLQEDLSLFEKICYKIQVNDTEKAERILKQANYSSSIEDNNLNVYLENNNIHEVIEVLRQNDLIIQDIEKKIFRTEERYKKIFFEKR